MLIQVNDMTCYLGNICGESIAKGVKGHGKYTIHMISVALKQCAMFITLFTAMTSVWMWGIFCRILSVMQNIVMALNNVMLIGVNVMTCYKLLLW
jgi:hypothetical protein